MTHRWVLVSMVAGVVATVPAAVSAQRGQSPQPQFDVEELTPGQIQRAQEPQPPNAPAPKAVPKTAPKPAQPAHAVACSGAFAKDSSHLRLVTAFKPDNVVFTDVDAPEGQKLMASVLFPKDPKRRLEVWWENETSRAGTYLIVINGQSTWTAPKGLRLGLQLAALEKLNGKPFKIKGFGKDNLASVSDWQEGALASLPGGCRAGINLRLDAKAPPAARTEVSGSGEFVSSDASMRAVKPAIAEILLGY